MSFSADYQLLDFGQGRKLERFGGHTVDRPCPVASDPCMRPELWPAQQRFDRDAGQWRGTAAAGWGVRFGELAFELAATESGQVGVFPEQAPNWAWLAERLAGRGGARVLNLFGYTGGSTLAAAAAGAQVTHIDASKSVVRWARRNAERSGLAGAPIRWIVEDAVKFVGREIKRGQRYDGIILDPPSYGHGPKREQWKLSRDLVGLLDQCKQLLSERPALFLVSCHTPGFEEAELGALVTSCLFGHCAAGVRSRPLQLHTEEGASLASGCAAYWP